MTTIGLTPSKKLTLYGKKVEALFTEGAVPEKLAEKAGFSDYLISPVAAASETGSGTDQSDTAASTRLFNGDLALVYGFLHHTEDHPQTLPEPVLMLLPGSGRQVGEYEKNNDPGDQRFPTEKYLRWSVALDDPAVLFASQETTLEAALGLAVPLGDGFGMDGFGGGMDSGGFTLRGADGRVYYVPEALDTFQVLDDGERGPLMLAPGTDRDDLKVRELLDDGVGGAIQSRAMDPAPKALQSNLDILRAPSHCRVTEQQEAGLTLLRSEDDLGRFRNRQSGLETESKVQHLHWINPDDPLSAKTEARWAFATGRGDWQISTRSWTRMLIDQVRDRRIGRRATGCDLVV